MHDHQDILLKRLRRRASRACMPAAPEGAQPHTPDRPGTPSGEAGHTLLIVVVMVAVMVISSTVAVRVWDTVVKRDHEEELIYRGKQYAQALYLYRKALGKLPTDLKELDQPGPRNEHFIRQLYKDPVTGGDFGLVYLGPNGTPISDSQLEGDQPVPGLTDAKGTGLSGFTSSFPSKDTGTSRGALSGPNRGLGTPTTGGLAIMGVHSKSTASVKGPSRWRDLEHYNEWLFLITDLAWGVQPGQGIQPGPGLQPGQAFPGGRGGGPGPTPESIKH